MEAKVFFENANSVKTVEELFLLLRSFEQNMNRNVRHLKSELLKLQDDFTKIEILEAAVKKLDKNGVQTGRLDELEEKLAGLLEMLESRQKSEGETKAKEVSSAFEKSHDSPFARFTDPKYLEDQRAEVLARMAAAQKGTPGAATYALLLQKLSEVNIRGAAGQPEKKGASDSAENAEVNTVYKSHRSVQVAEISQGIEEYDGDPLVSLNSYFNRLRLFLMQQPFLLTADQQLAHLVGRLKGRALFAYNAMPAATKGDFDALEAALKLKFPNTECVRAAENELQSCQQGQGENVHDFAQRVATLIHTILEGKPEDEIERNLRRETLNRLHDDIREDVQGQDPDTYDKVLLFARRREANLKRKADRAITARRTAFETFPVESPSRCYTCNLPGHFARECPQKFQRQQQRYNFQGSRQNGGYRGSNYRNDWQRNTGFGGYRQRNSNGFGSNSNEGNRDDGRRLIAPRRPQHDRQLSVRFAEDNGQQRQSHEMNPVEAVSSSRVRPTVTRRPKPHPEATFPSKKHKSRGAKVRIDCEGPVLKRRKMETPKPKVLHHEVAQLENQATEATVGVSEDLLEGYLSSEDPEASEAYNKEVIRAASDPEAASLPDIAVYPPSPVPEAQEAAKHPRIQAPQEDEVIPLAEALRTQLVIGSVAGDEEVMELANSTPEPTEQVLAESTISEDLAQDPEIGPPVPLTAKQRRNKKRRDAYKFRHQMRQLSNENNGERVLHRANGTVAAVIGAKLNWTLVNICFILGLLLPLTTAATMTTPHANLCFDTTPRMLLRLPQDYHCTDPPGFEAEVREVTLPILRPNTVQYEAIADHCYCVQSKPTHSRTFFTGTHVYTEEKTATAVSLSECEELRAQRANGDLKDFDGFHGTDKKATFYDRNWPLWVQTDALEIRNCYISNLTILSQHGSKPIQKVVGPGYTCDFQDGICEMREEGLLIWQPDLRQRCQFVDALTLNGSISDNIFIDSNRQFALSFKSFEPVIDCNETLLITEQGYAVPKSSYDAIHVREKRSVLQTGPVYSNQLSAQLTAIQQNSEMLNRHSFSTALQYFCTSMKELLKTIMTLALANPSLLARDLLNTTDVRARLVSQNLLEVQTCESIPLVDLRYVPMGECFDLLPVELVYQRKKLQAYLDPITLDLVREARAVECANVLPIYLPSQTGYLKYDQSAGTVRSISEVKEASKYQQQSIPDLKLLRESRTFQNMVIANLSELYNFQTYHQATSKAISVKQLIRELSSLDEAAVDAKNPQVIEMAQKVVSEGLFGFLKGGLLDWTQGWIFATCLATTLQFMVKYLLPMVIQEALKGLNLFQAAASIRNQADHWRIRRAQAQEVRKMTIQFLKAQKAREEEEEASGENDIDPTAARPIRSLWPALPVNVVEVSSPKSIQILFEESAETSEPRDNPTLGDKTTSREVLCSIDLLFDDQFPGIAKLQQSYDAFLKLQTLGNKDMVISISGPQSKECQEDILLRLKPRMQQPSNPAESRCFSAIASTATANDRLAQALDLAPGYPVDANTERFRHKNKGFDEFRSSLSELGCHLYSCRGETFVVSIPGKETLFRWNQLKIENALEEAGMPYRSVSNTQASNNSYSFRNGGLTSAEINAVGSSLAHVYGTVEDWESNCLLDTGAAISLITHALVRELELPILKTKPINLIGVGQTDFATIGYVEVPLSIQGWTSTVRLHVFAPPTLPSYDVLVGCDTLGLMPPVTFDFQKSRVTFGSYCVPIFAVENKTIDVVFPIPDAPQNEQHKILELLTEFTDIISTGDTDLGKCTIAAPPVVLTGPQPKPARLHKTTQVDQEATKAFIKESLDAGLVRHSTTSCVHNSVVVDKANGSKRVCIDLRRLNAVVQTDPYPLADMNDLITRAAGSSWFTCIDLACGFLQIPLAPESTHLFGIICSEGVYEFLFMPFGYKNAPGVFQRIMRTALGSLELFAVAYLDDILVFTGPDDLDLHLQHVRQVFERLRQYCLKIRASKCQLARRSVIYCGHKLNQKGFTPSEKHIAALKEMKPPTSTKQVRAFLGLVNFFRRFCDSFAILAEPLNHLLHKGVPFEWNQAHQESFDALLKVLTSPPVLQAPKAGLPFIIYTDASLKGLGATVLQPGEGNQLHVITYISRGLSDAEKNYTVSEIELLALIFVLEHQRHILLGHPISWYTDHKPLSFLRQKIAKSSRLTRWLLQIQEFDVNFNYVPGPENGMADWLSRTPVEVNAVTLDAYNAGKVIRLATQNDPLLQEVIQFCLHNWMHAEGTGLDPALKPYLAARRHLTYRTGLLFHKNRLVVPEGCRSYVLGVLHRSHSGINRMLRLARQYVWWPELTTQADQHVALCSSCQSLANAAKPAPVVAWPKAHHPWERMHMDFAGEFEGAFWLILVDVSTKYPFVERMSTITSAATINQLEKIFGYFSCPGTLVSDNGPQLVSAEFETYLDARGITHVLAPPYHPPSNGLAERFVQTFKQAIRKIRGNDPEISTPNALKMFLHDYRNTPHSTTGTAPAVALFGRLLSHPLDLFRKEGGKTAQRAAPTAADLPHQLKFAEKEPVWRRILNPAEKKTRKWSPAIVEKSVGRKIYAVFDEDSANSCNVHEDDLRARRTSSRHPSTDAALARRPSTEAAPDDAPSCPDTPQL